MQHMIINPDISVIMAVRNGISFLDQSIPAILRQTFGNFEFIIIDDGSTDGSGQLLEKYNALDERISIVSQENQGLTKALNTAINRAKAPLIAIQDVDDISLPRRLESQIKEFQKDSSLVLCGTGSQALNPPNKKVLRAQAGVICENQILRERLKYVNAIRHSSAMFRKDVFIRVGRYCESFIYSQDINLWHRMAQVGTIKNIPDVLLHYSNYKNSVSNRHTDHQIMLSALSCTLYASGYTPVQMVDAVKNIHTKEDIIPCIHTLKLPEKHFHFSFGMACLQRGRYKAAKKHLKKGYHLLETPALKGRLLWALFPIPIMKLIKTAYFISKKYS
ncbi:MAG: glycosyltransferase [Chitinivibrionales bacterium]|nr:glycosyltransferase [Chitinivibrionales bacterium]